MRMIDEDDDEDDSNNNNNNNNNNNDDDDDDDNRIERRNSRFFYNLLTAPRTVSNTCAQVARVQTTCNTSCAYLVQHVMLRATRYEETAQLLSWTQFKIAFIFSFILLAEPLTDEGGEGNQSTRRKPRATSFRKCHVLKPEDSSPKRDSNPHNSIGGRQGKQTC